MSTLRSGQRLNWSDNVLAVVRMYVLARYQSGQRLYWPGVCHSDVRTFKKVSEERDHW